jgi:signal transduction histidine kinase
VLSLIINLLSQNGVKLKKKVVNNHNGDVRAVSAPGKGAAFHVILPL